MIDANKLIDTLKLRFYNEYLYTNHVYDEGESPFHKQLTEKVITDFVDKLELPKDAHILDLGCGPGYFLDEMKKRGYTNLTGVTLSQNDIDLCVSKGHTIKQYDLSFLPQVDGYYDECVDFIFLRHALEHSPYPIFSLMEYNRVLKQYGKIYIEVPAVECERQHERNLNHYSVLTSSMWIALFERTGFNIDEFREMEFKIQFPDREIDEKAYIFVLSKVRALDVK